MVDVTWLKKAELFEALSESQLNLLLFHSTVESFPEETVLFRQGEEANRFYVLIKGLVELTVKTQGEAPLMTSQIQKEGAVFGIPSLLEPYRYNVTATCLKATNVLMMDAEYIKRHMEEDPRMGMEILKKLTSIYFTRLNELRLGVSNLLQGLKPKTP